MRSRSVPCLLALLGLVATVPSCVVARWDPVAARPESLNRHAVRASRPDGSRIVLEGATLSGDTLRGETCASLSNGPPSCVERSFRLSDFSALEVRRVDALTSTMATGFAFLAGMGVFIAIIGLTGGLSWSF